MNFEQNTILFTLIYKEEEYPIQTHKNQYHTLMTLVSDRLAITSFGLCCGMGSCGTCLVEIRENYSSITRIVTSCSIHIDDDLANTRIYIPNSVY